LTRTFLNREARNVPRIALCKVLMHSARLVFRGCERLLIPQAVVH
jgi:hypothetical protein